MRDGALGREYFGGETIIQQGETGDCMYVVQSGSVEVVQKVNGGEQRLAILETGDFFGEMALFEARPRQNDVVALTKCRLLVLDYDDFEHLCQREPEIANQIRGIAEARGKAGRAGKPQSKPAVRVKPV